MESNEERSNEERSNEERSNEKRGDEFRDREAAESSRETRAGKDYHRSVRTRECFRASCIREAAGSMGLTETDGAFVLLIHH